MIENLEFAEILQYLYLQNNLIREIPPLPMANLTKLYLGENEVQYISGLEACVRLEELHVARQRLPPLTSLDFDPASLDVISKTLRVLDISGDGIRSLLPFRRLVRLRKFICSENEVSDLSHVEEIVSLPELEEANFKGSPCCKLNRYRDHVIGASTDTLKILDEVDVLRHQHIAIRGLQAHRRKLGVALKVVRSLDEGEDHDFGSADERDVGQAAPYQE